MEIGRGLLAGVETEVRVLHGIRRPPREADINAGGMAVTCLVGADPDQLPPG